MTLEKVRLSDIIEMRRGNKKMRKVWGIFMSHLEKVWDANLAGDMYKNPILYTDYSDPDVCRVGNDYFMVASSFCNAPGLPVLHSKDMVNWEVISYALEKVPGQQYDKPLHGCGVWAPAIRYREGEYIIFFPMPDEGIFVVKTKDPWGKWDEPTCLYEGKGWIDPCPFWDDDGKAYMVSAFAKSRIGFKSILHLTEITPDCLQMIGEGKHIFDGNETGQETIEGPKLYKRNGYYYIFAPAGGVKQGWQTVLRSKNIWGPYEYREVCMQKDSTVNGPHQGAWVQTQTGEDWFFHFQDVYAAGRIIHLQPMTWKEDWPIIGQYEKDEICGKPVACFRKPNVGASYQPKYPAASDDFETDKLGLQWQWNANPKKDWYHFEENGLVLSAVSSDAVSISDMPNLLLQKWHMPEFSCVSKMQIDSLTDGDQAGIISMGVGYGALTVQKINGQLSIAWITGEQKFSNERASATDEITCITSLPEQTKEIFFGLEVNQLPSIAENNDGPFTFPIPREEIVFSYSLDGEKYHQVSKIDAKAGRWVGVKSGVFCAHSGVNNGGNVKVMYFHFGENIVY